MTSRRSLTDRQREEAVLLFAKGYGAEQTATRVRGSKHAVAHLYDRWRLRGGAALVPKPTKRTFSFDEKHEIVQQYLAGTSAIDLARDYELSSPKLIERWVKLYRDVGEDGLRPKPKGRPKRNPDTPPREETELQRLRRENLRLRAEVAYLGKLRALSGRERG